MEIINAKGRIVLENAKINNDNSIDISGLHAGIFYIHVKFDELKS